MTRVRRLKWAVVGVGVAGRARAKAIVADPRAQLVAVWRGRFADQAGAPIVASLDEAIAAADAVAICSPTHAHPEQVRAVLDAGRHALVEFPLAPSADGAMQAFEHARRVGKVLHVEHIELLDATAATLCAHVRVETVRHVRVEFDGVGPTDASAVDLAVGNVARLHRAIAFAGPIAEVTQVDHEPGQLTAELRLDSGARMSVRFRQAPYYVRRTALDVETVAARWTQDDDQLSRDGMPVTLVGLGGLFSRDQRAATARILDGAPHYVDELRVLHVMDVVDRLGRLATGVVPQRSDAALPG